MAKIEIRDLTFSFRAPPSTFAISIYEALSRQDYSNSKIKKLFCGLNIDLSDGDLLALTGFNGSGKSTFLRILAGIYPPTSGTIKVTGKITSMFSLAGHVQPPLTGYENLILLERIKTGNPFVKKKDIDEIIEFSGLDGAIADPLYTYSDGMKMRLLFSSLTSANSEILLIDEVIGVGDEDFQKKARDRVKNRIEASGIAVIASHSKEIRNTFANMEIDLGEGGNVRKL
jgi:ABC-type polysaccharide/polyol phosphate transport system ATPase subunit